jgi:hypothetical protein
MEGFLDGVPVLAKVAWQPQEVPLLAGKPTTYGLVGDVSNGDGSTTRYFVPWSAVLYLRQVLPAPPAGDIPEPVVKPGNGPPPDAPGHN